MSRLGRAQPFKPIIKAPYPFAPNVQFNSKADSGYQAAQSSYSFNRTINGNNRFLAVDVGLLSPGQTVTSVIDDSGGANVALTLIKVQSTVTSFGRIETWGLVAPAYGTKAIQVNLSGSIASAAGAVGYTGVQPNAPYEAANSAQATNIGAADATVTVTPLTDNTWLHAAVATDDGAITAGQTARNNVTGAGGSAADEDTGPITPAAATALSYTDVGALATWAIAGYAIRPLAAGPGNVTFAAAVGTFTLTGQAASFVRNVPITAAKGTFNLTGNAVGFVKNAPLSVAKGTFTLTGNAAILSWSGNTTIAAGTGTFSLSGKAANFTEGGSRTMTAAKGTFALTGNAANFSTGSGGSNMGAMQLLGVG